MDSEDFSSSPSTSPVLLGRACLEAALYDDESESDDAYESIDDFVKEASAYSPSPPYTSSWRPSRFEGSIRGFRGSARYYNCPSSRSDVSDAKPQPPPRLAAKLGTSMDFPSRVADLILESEKRLSKAKKLSPPPPPPSDGASMSDRLPPPTATQVAALMPVQNQLACFSKSVESFSSNYSLASQTDTTLPSVSLGDPLLHHVQVIGGSVEPHSNTNWISSHSPSGDAMISISGSMTDRLPPPPPPAASVPPPLNFSASDDYFSPMRGTSALRRASALEFAGPPLPVCYAEMPLSRRPTPPHPPFFGTVGASFSTSETPALRVLSEMVRDASPAPVFEGPPRPLRRLSSEQYRSPSPFPPPTGLVRVGASFSSRSKAAGPAVLGHPMPAPLSVPASGGFGGFLHSINEPLGVFGSSSSRLSEAFHLQQPQLMQQVAQKQVQVQIQQPLDTAASVKCKLAHIDEVSSVINVDMEEKNLSILTHF